MLTLGLMLLSLAALRLALFSGERFAPAACRRRSITQRRDEKATHVPTNALAGRTSAARIDFEDGPKTNLGARRDHVFARAVATKKLLNCVRSAALTLVLANRTGFALRTICKRRRA